MVQEQNGADLTRTDIESEERQAFVAQAEERTKNAILAIRAIAELNDPKVYEYGPRDVRKIGWALNREIEFLKKKLSETDEDDKINFRL